MSLFKHKNTQNGLPAADQVVENGLPQATVDLSKNGLPSEEASKKSVSRKVIASAGIAALSAAAIGIGSSEKSTNNVERIAPAPITETYPSESNRPSGVWIEPQSSDTDKPAVPEKHDDGTLPGNPNVPADQDPGTPDVAGDQHANPGDSPSYIENLPAEIGQDPAHIDPNGSANVPGTDNQHGQE